jgi:hypothetical protein
MSKCYDLVCDLCKVSLWIAQGPTGSSEHAPLQVYNTAEHHQRLTRFLEQHRNHRLRFLYDMDTPYDYEDVEETEPLASA